MAKEFFKGVLNDGLPGALDRALGGSTGYEGPHHTQLPVTQPANNQGSYEPDDSTPGERRAPMAGLPPWVLPAAGLTLGAVGLIALISAR